jgi:hypothetical protein
VEYHGSVATITAIGYPPTTNYMPDYITP